MKYELLYEFLDGMDIELTDDILDMEEQIDELRREQILLESNLAEILLLRAEIRQFLKESGVIDDETENWA